MRGLGGCAASARRPRPAAGAPAIRRARRWPRPFRGRAAVPTGCPARRLGERRRRKTASDSGAPCCPRRACGLDEPLDRPRSPAGSLTSRCSATRASCRVLGDQVGGTAVALRALRARDPRIGAARGRAGAQTSGSARLEDPRVVSRSAALGRLELVEAREPRRRTRSLCSRIARAPASRPASVGQATELEMNRPTDRPCTDSFDVACGLRGRSDPSLLQRPDELPQQETAFLPLHARRPPRRPDPGLLRVPTPRVGRRQPSSTEAGARRSGGGRSCRQERRGARRPCPPRAGGSPRRARRSAPRGV